MKDWDRLEPDEYRLINRHYTKGRQGHRIDKIILHHNAANLSIGGCWSVWQSRPASAQYQVDVAGRIGQLVHDSDTSWNAGNWNANVTSIAIEHADMTTSPWSISEATLDNGAHLVAALCKAYRLGRPIWLRNVYPHSYFSATACPASIRDSQRDEYMQRAQAYYDQMTGNRVETVIRPDINRVINRVVNTVASSVPQITVDGYAGPATIKRMQQLLGTPQDGIVSSQPVVNKRYLPNATNGWQWVGRASGSTMVRRLQERLGVTVDGLIGRDTIKALQRRLGVTVDGVAGAATFRALQTNLNRNRLW